MNKIVSSTQQWVEKDRRVWVTTKQGLPNPYGDAFLEAKVVDILPKEIKVVLRQKEDELHPYTLKDFTVSYEDCQKLTYGANDVSDMVDLQELNEPELLYNLKRRYLNDLIFTYCGPTLVIINPYQHIDKLFNDQLLLEYQTYVFQDNLEYKTLPPHVFSLAAFCLWQLFDNMRNQSIVISGQSGAGKTQNTKFCLKFLSSLGKNMKGLTVDRAVKLISSKALKSIHRITKLHGIQDKILGCNEILEAFGNAKTIRNDNSSRFGKLILLLYGESQTDIKSAFIVSYLLEKSRIVSIGEGERNYHIFYYFLKGTSAEEKKAFLLTKPMHQYKYINQSSVFDIRGVSDETKYAEVQQEFKSYFNSQETHCIFSIISSVLNLGNLTFRKQLSKNNEEMAVVINKQYLANVATLLGLELDGLLECFQFKTRKIGGNIINSPLKYEEAVALQNSFSKNMYQKTFLYLVSKLNEKIELQKVNLQESSKGFRKSIGLLDIFGFEVLEVNSLEQFFINFANEKLQQLYVSYIFKEEQNEFLKQGLKQFSHDIGFQDNKPVIDLFELYPLGLFHLINESSELNKPDEHLPQSITRNHPKNSFVQIPKSKRGMFLISHSCSPVNYNTHGFSSRNKDQFPQQLLDVILMSGNQILKIIIGGDAKQSESKSRSAAKKFLGSKFLNDMNKLTEQLYSSDCHFVRCIKPNSEKAPKKFTSQAVLQSLRYLGVLDSILIRKLGYIYRRPFKQFIKKFFEIEQYIYGFKDFVAGKSEDDFKDYSKNFILKYAPNQLGNREILLGHKKILIKQCALNYLEAMAKEKRKMRIQCANKIKRMYVNSVFRGKTKAQFKRIAIMKGYLCQLVGEVRTQIMNTKCSKVQKVVRRYLMQKRLQKIKEQATKSVTKIAAYYRMKKERSKFLDIRRKTIKVQANIRFMLTMAAYFRFKNCREVAYEILQIGWKQIQYHKAVLIQKAWKGYSVRRRFKQVMEQIRKKLRLARYRQHLLQAIFHHKLQNYLKVLNGFRNPIVKMQALVRGRLVRRTYLTVKRAAIFIQKAYRRHLRKKYYLIRLWREYRKLIYSDERHKAREMGRLCLAALQTHGVKYYPQTVSKTMQYFPRELISRYAKGEEGRAQWILNETISFSDKNTIQMYIGDYDVIGTQYYNGKWLLKYAEIKEQLKRKGQYPINVSLGEQFTSVLSNKEKIYTFYSGENTLAPRTELTGNTHSIAQCDRAGYLLKNDGSAYVWGYNYDNFIQKGLCEFVELKDETNLAKYKINGAWLKGDKRYFTETEGKVLTIGLHQKGWQRQYRLTTVEFGFKNSIKALAVSYNFVVFLNFQGIVYACGDNSRGQLGLGVVSDKEVLQPQAVRYLSEAKEIIETVSAGMSHVVAKSKLGYVYTWGDNCYRQVSNQEVPYRHTPEILQSEEGKLKVLQAVAGARSTYILSDSLKTIAWGTSSSFVIQKSVASYALDLIRQTASCKSLVEVKLSVRWIREMTVLFVSGLDMGRCRAGTKPDVIIKYAKMIAKEWQDDKVYPDYHEWTDNILQLSDLRRFKFSHQSTPISAKAKKSRAQNPAIEELRALIELRKTSAVFKRAAVQKMQQALLRLRGKNESQLSEQDRQLSRFIQQNLGLLK